MRVANHIAPGIVRLCECRGRFRRLWHKDLAGGVHRQKYRCEQCGAELIETLKDGHLVAPERTASQKPEPKPSGFPHWLALPVSADCWSRRV